MKDDAHRGIGAVLIAFAVIGLLLWLAMTRLSPQTTLTVVGGGVALLLLAALGAGIVLIRRHKD